MFKPVNPREDLNKQEKEIIKYWKKNKIFERSVQERADSPVYSFFDGPPFATGVPHYGTILSSIAKDVVPRYWTMKGYRVDRRWGWDCHGLPAEHMVEKKLGINSKEEIENKIGIEKFNETCYSTICQIADDWEEIISRIGRWVDFKNAYRTMDKGYMESIWWAFKELYNKNLIYEDTRISLYCSRCETPLSNFEIAMDNSYKDVVDVSVFVRFKIEEGPYKDNDLLVWTTTPWTLPANTGLAVGRSIDYIRVKTSDRQTLIIAKEREEELKGKYAVIDEIKGADLEGYRYKPLYADYTLEGGDEENVYRIWPADFVSTKEGTGVVHIAPSFGEDDFKLAKDKNIPVIDNLDSTADYKEGRWKGRNIKDVNKKIVTDLGVRKLIYREKPVTHSYPFCYRCKTKLIYKTQAAWFLNISKIRNDLLDKNEKINWNPEHLRHGRFQKGLESAPDWNISRDRYWGTAMPVWRCRGCGKIHVVGSYEELFQLSGQRLEDYHRPYVDDVNFKCECGDMFERIPQVFDVWFDSGSMPYGERHYPFENQEDFSLKFPADYIVEYISQVRGWFYTLHVLAVALFSQPAFQNVVTTGVIAGEDGRKMSKSLGNYTDPVKVLERYGADALRFYLMSSPIMEAQNISFSTKDVEEVKRGLISTYWNSFAFFMTYAAVDGFKVKEKLIKDLPSNVLDRWILSELNLLMASFEEHMDNYQIAKAARLIPDFVDKLSNWYIRRSRRRFWKSGNSKDKEEAYETLYEVLYQFTKMAAPFIPFTTEAVFRKLTGEDSVHLTNFPQANRRMIDKKLMTKMEKLRNLVKIALAIRAKHAIKVRQPLSRIYINQKDLVNDEELAEIILEEVNVKNISYSKVIEERKNIGVNIEGDLMVGININITANLEGEGKAREIIRHIQSMRKKAGYEVDDRIVINYTGGKKIFGKFAKMIAKETLAKILEPGHLYDPDLKETIKLGRERVTVEINRIERES
ncbi:MAG: isoleucine--tRNA ligase [Candidatus Moranbacteria bacterium]|nr:isoleucine--tRNA ligase [Candidatus Moranbacteria bacterium]